MKILLCSVPDGADKPSKPLVPRGQTSVEPIFPLGIQRVMSSVQEHGYDGEIYDINNLRHSDDEIVRNIKKVQPNIVGLSGPLSHCYPHIKRISKLIRKNFPDAWIIIGGNVAGSAHILLHQTEADITVVGDGEIPFLKLLKFFENNLTRDRNNSWLSLTSELCKIPGLAYLDENNKVNFTGFAEQLPAHKMGYPNYDVWENGLEKFGGDRNLALEVFEKINSIGDLIGLAEERSHRTKEYIELFEKNKGKRAARIQTSKGCVAKCTFCQRATQGYRTFKAETLEERIIELKEKYDVATLVVDDENFGSDKVKSYECAKVFKKHGIHWYAQGARASTVTYESLKFYKENNMMSIRFGIETGSKKILELMEKKTTKTKVYDAIANCKKLNINTAVEVMLIGMPGETRETVIETAEYAASLRFLVGNDWNTSYPGWVAAIPGTPVYEYCQQVGIIGETIEEEEKYLIVLADEMEQHGILNYLNKTEADRKELYFWPYIYRYIGKKAYVEEIIKNNTSIIKILKDIYTQCFKEAFNTYVKDLKRRIHKTYPIKQNIQQFGAVTVKFLIAFLTPFMPRKVLLYFLKKVSDKNYKELERKYRNTEGEQKYNFFVEPNELREEYKFTHEQYLKSKRPIENSLRTIVKRNSEIMGEQLSKEKIDLNTIAKMQ
tara:strand:- start:127 stop:2121 length:1995 start_codon:yes stop_codon:yes gene_type:complete